MNRLLLQREAGAPIALRQNVLWAHRYECAAVLERHGGCVNSLSWSADGRTLLSGSDDRTVGVWSFSGSWEGTCRAALRTKHRGNIFEAKQCPLEPELVVTSGADGLVGLSHMAAAREPQGFEPPERSISSKLDFCPGAPRVVLVPFSSGYVRLFDLRVGLADGPTVVLLGSVGANDVKFRPWAEAEFALACDDHLVRVYDLRFPAGSVAEVGGRISSASAGATACYTQPFAGGCAMGVSGVCWSRSGQQLLVNYREADPALFDLPGTAAAAAALDAIPEEEPYAVRIGAPKRRGEQPPVRSLAPRQVYRGRVNSDTCCKEATFLLDGACVATGGDCGHLYIWRAGSGALVRRIAADRSIVNCVAAHPSLPLLASSGIDDEVKLWDVGGDFQDARSDGRVDGSLLIPDRLWDLGLRSARSISRGRSAEAVRAAAAAREEGNALFREGQLAAAAARYNAALARLSFIPPNARVSDERRALLVATCLNLSLCHLRLGEPSDALRLSEVALLIEPGSVKALFRRASALLAQQEYALAERDVAAGLALEPASAELLRLRQAVSRARAAERRAESARFSHMFAGGGRP